MMSVYAPEVSIQLEHPVCFECRTLNAAPQIANKLKAMGARR